MQERVLVLRAGIGAARPHSRRGVARKLDMRVSRVRHIERRGLRKARALARHGACGRHSVAAGAAASGGGVAAGGGGLITPPSAPATSGGGASSSSSSSSGSGGSGDVRGESEVNLPPPLDNGPGRHEEPGGLSLAIGIALILLALVAGFATPHLRGRLRSGRPA